MGKLSDWAKENSQFIKLADKESIELVYKGFKIVPNKFDTEKESIRYIFLVEGKEKFWENGAGYIAEYFDNVKEGEVVKITRKGEGNQTKYELEAVIE